MGARNIHCHYFLGATDNLEKRNNDRFTNIMLHIFILFFREELK